MSSTKRAVTFVTSNMKKVAEVKQILSDYDVTHVSIDLPELQGTSEEIIRAKTEEAFHQLKTNVLVEDTALGFNALDGLPGPYIKHFLSNLGPSGLYRLLQGFEDKTATAICLFGYKSTDSDEVRIFKGICRGQIVEPRCGDHEPFGWDPCFLPDGSDQTFGEMEPLTKHQISHRSRALVTLQEYFSNSN